MLISDKVDSKARSIMRDKGTFIMIKRSIQQKDRTVLNLC